MTDDDEIQITLSKAEAIVLFDLLSEDFLNKLADSSLLDDKNKIWPLISIVNTLESQLTEPFDSNFKDIVRESLNKVIEQNGSLM